jgi:hypothetical protein
MPRPPGPGWQPPALGPGGLGWQGVEQDAPLAYFRCPPLELLMLVASSKFNFLRGWACRNWGGPPPGYWSPSVRRLLGPSGPLACRNPALVQACRLGWPAPWGGCTTQGGTAGAAGAAAVRPPECTRGATPAGRAAPMPGHVLRVLRSGRDPAGPQSRYRCCRRRQEAAGRGKMPMWLGLSPPPRPSPPPPGGQAPAPRGCRVARARRRAEARSPKPAAGRSVSVPEPIWGIWSSAGAPAGPRAGPADDSANRFCCPTWLRANSPGKMSTSPARAPLSPLLPLQPGRSGCSAIHAQNDMAWGVTLLPLAEGNSGALTRLWGRFIWWWQLG